MQNNNQTPAAVPYYIHEGITARMERSLQRMAFVAAVSTVSLAAGCLAILIQKQ